jgi:hypothetical protein
MLDAQGRIRDLSTVIPDIAGDEPSPKGLTKLRKVNVDKLPLVRGTPRTARASAKSAISSPLGLTIPATPVSACPGPYGSRPLALA